MAMQPQVLDVYAILETTTGAPREKALRFRQELIELLRALEDMHDFPRSVPTKEARIRSTSGLEADREARRLGEKR